jgi:hypothetical protein
LSGLDTLLPDAELPASLLRAARSFAVARSVFVGIVFFLCADRARVCEAFFLIKLVHVSPPGPY